jgi:hypothetical protein
MVVFSDRRRLLLGRRGGLLGRHVDWLCEVIEQKLATWAIWIG